MNELVRITDTQTQGRFEIAYCTGIGKRSSQQDGVCAISSDRGLFGMVCDGVGGLSGGEQATAAAVAVFGDEYQYRIDWIKDRKWMIDMARLADAKICAIRDEKGKTLAAGTTATAVWVQGRELYWISCGDSRMYLFHDEASTQVSTDLNYSYLLEQKRRDGAISQEQYQQEIRRGASLISFLGQGKLTLMDRNLDALKLYPGDVILLCTDGLYHTLDENWMRETLRRSGSMEQAARTFAWAVEKYGPGHQDNYTGLLIKVLRTDGLE